ncbi:MAG: heavy metal translocating P-type ATPase [Gemmatimonadota bacterium]|nr:heavy metal translocating P-type ATPase [Gemmatimonadota bacterium]
MIRAVAIPITTLLVILTGLAFQAGPLHLWGTRLWLVGLVCLGAPVVWQTAAGAFRGRLAADLVATLAIITAILLEQPLPGLVVVLMQTGGEALERFAAGRASRAVAALEAEAPRVAHRQHGDEIEDVAADLVAADDRVVVRPGEMVPCDGEVIEGRSSIDHSRLTGEPMPLAAAPGTALLSGSLNLDGPLVIRVVRVARESQYARIVDLVRTAQQSKSPLQRLADRYAVIFTPVTLAVCVIAWAISRDPLRVLSVLVVATPCPLILAAPVAMIGGINRAARRRIIIRHGEALERLGNVTAALLDKTGTITIGRPALASVSPVAPFSEAEVLGLAAAVDAGSGHLLARSVVAEALRRGLPSGTADAVIESPGQGVTGEVGGHQVMLGARSFVLGRHPGLAGSWRDTEPTALRAWLVVDGRAAGTLAFADQIRPEARPLLARLARLGIRRIIMVTGDDASHAEAIARAVGIEDVRAGLLPADKVAVVAEMEQAGYHVMMLGDGTNDAPALSRASVGVALAANGGGITAEAADVVVLADDPLRVADAIEISQRTMRIARQSVWVGLGLSGVAMLAAAAGAIPPTIGAILQEIIDVAVILNALRASTAPGTGA